MSRTGVLYKLLKTGSCERTVERLARDHLAEHVGGLPGNRAGQPIDFSAEVVLQQGQEDGF
jgi:hypothetical protein